MGWGGSSRRRNIPRRRVGLFGETLQLELNSPKEACGAIPVLMGIRSLANALT